MRKITIILLVNLFMFSVLGNLYSQSQVIEKCGFDHQRSILLQDSNYLKLEIDAEQKIAQYISQTQLRSSSSIYTIPVVVHVLHLGESVGVGTNISDAQIQSAITNLNDVYRGQTVGSPVDFEIEFALAQQDPNCIAHYGINRINASSVPNYSTGGVDYYGDGGEADQDVLKNLSRWPETEYFNIWIVSEIENNNGGFGIQGYANFFTGSALEGSVMMASVFGYDPNNSQSSFNLNAPRDNSTVIHEFGHYLHLHHTFKGDGDANNDGLGDACPGDVTIGVDSDGCLDTEPHKRYTSQCKSGFLNDCTGATFGDNTAKNFMSYASCQDRLTSDQKTRSRAMLATSGISLIYSKGDEIPLSLSGTISNANCIPQSSFTATNGGYGGIMNFTIINEFSASSSYTQIDGGYLDFTNECLKTISLEEDSTYNFELTTWYNGHDFKGYIDFNNDGDFSDLNEEVFSGANPPNLNQANGSNTSSGNGTLSIPITDGVNVLANTPLRLRIITELISVGGFASNAITGPCYNPFYAQAEDYQLVINQSTASLSTDFTASNTNVCLGTAITFSDASTGNPTSWAWNFGDGNSSTLQNPTHIYISAGTYDVSLTATTSTGTESETKNGFITVNTNPNVNAGIDQTICEGNNGTLNATSGQNYITGVTATGASDYIFSGAFFGNDPPINISLGDTLTFNVNSLGHPFLIKTTATTGTVNAVSIANNGTSSGSIIWSPTTVGIYYYICEFHSGMVGTITVGSSNVNYSWDNSIINGVAFNPTTTNTYTVTGTDSNGCIATDNVTINLLPNNTGTSVVTECGSYTWIDGITYTATNNSATYTFTNSAGCDSVISLNLTINPIENSQENITTCNYYNWNGMTYSQTGTYLDTLQTINGCDSIATLNLTISNYILDSESITSCSNYSWNGNIYNQSGNYTDTISVASGCDTIAILNLTIGQTYSSTENIISCGAYNWSGTNYSQSGSYNDTLQTNFGCDSIVTLILTINPAISYSETAIVCDNYFWNGNNYSQSGIYNDTLTTNSGCDSIVTLFLTVNSSTIIQEIISTCGSYTWHGNNYSQTGSYYDTLTTVSGCDSISSLLLTINTPQQTTESVFSCSNYLWNGNIYPQSGVFIDTLQTSQGCDSITILDLNIYDSFNTVDSVSSCQSYIWNGVQYDSSGVYTDTLQTALGCDSINTLFLTVNDNTEAPLTLELLLDDYCLETFWTIKDSQDSLWYSEGPYDCNPSGSGNQANTTIIKNIYLDANECYTFELNDLYGDGLSASIWNGTDGNWVLADLNSNIISQGQGDFGFNTSKSFNVNQSIPSLIIEDNSAKLEIIVYPNPFSNSTTVKIINGKEPYILELFDISGRIVKTLKSNLSEFTIDGINASSGVYWLKIKNQSKLKPIKLIIE